ncbi:MAG: ParB N-terminal domain-containing protein [Lentisphaeraceae bacterium]|nr:ParB N-terminal domain-containing protein [Lentisphaeraceae bacterium]
MNLLDNSGSAGNGTKNYSMFYFQSGNRPIDPENLRSLKSKIRKRNLLRFFPIVVSPDGTIIDGQHRLKIASALNLTIYYFVMEKEESIHITTSINSDKSSWTLENYLKAFSDNNTHYANLTFFLEKYSSISLKTVLNIMGYSKVIGINKFKKGELIFNPIINKVARESAKLAHSNSTVFLKALMRAIEEKNYKAPKKLTRVNSTSQYYQQIIK